MASSLCLFVFLLFIAPHFSTSFSAPIFLPLTHSLSTSRFNTTRHLLKAASARSAARFLHHRLGRRQVSLPLHPDIHYTPGDLVHFPSDYTINFTLDSHPPQSVSLYMDTGSDLVWFPCAPFHCIRCGGRNPNVVTLNRSSTSAVSCESPACEVAHFSRVRDPCAAARCPLKRIENSDCASFSCPPFYYAYGKGSLIATLYTHSVSFPTFSPALVLRNFTFGCAHSALDSPIGIAGFARSPLSLPTQLASLSPQLGNRFSYCLVSQSFEPKQDHRPSPLILGRKEVMSHEEAEFVYTEMLDNPMNPSAYLVGLQGISVGRKHIPSAENLRAVDGRGNGGMLVDSGSTFTTLPADLYGSVVAEFERRLGRVHKRATEAEHKTGLSPCYYFDNATMASVPTVTLHFVGRGSSVVLPRRNYFYDFMDGVDGGGSSGRRSPVGCLMPMSGGEEAEMDGGPMAILGNYQQQGFEVVYDLEKGRVGFARRNCSSLWDSLNQH